MSDVVSMYALSYIAVRPEWPGIIIIINELCNIMRINSYDDKSQLELRMCCAECTLPR